MTQIKVKKLPRDPGPAGWNCLLATPDPAHILDQKILADWLVVGGGFAGLAAARRLAQLHPADRIVLLEATRIGDGPAGRNSGFMIDLPHDLASDGYGGSLDADKDQTAANRAAIAFAKEMAREFGLPDEAFSQCGKINAAATAKGTQHNLTYAKHLSRMDEGHEMLDAQQMRNITGISYYQGGLFTPGTAIIQPAMFVRGVAGAIRSNRVQLFEKSPVISLTRNGNWVAQTPQGQVTAPKVILAVNGHINSFGFYSRRLMHVFTYASMTRALTLDEVKSLGGAGIWGVTPADPMGSTIRRIGGAGGDRIVVRNRFTYEPGMEVSDRRVASVARDHDKSFRARFPQLAHVDMEYRWGGRLCLSRNNVPAFGQIDENLFSACCQNGLGTAKGTLGGMLAAELASNVMSDTLKRVQGGPEPSRLPPAPVARLGASATLRWGELKAGREL